MTSRQTIEALKQRIQKIDAAIDALETERDVLQAQKNRLEASELLDMTAFAARVCGFRPSRSQ